MSEQLGFESVNAPIIYYGHTPTETEKESGEKVFEERQGPLKPGKWGHRTLRVFDGGRFTAYEASVMLCGDAHGKRREARRLLDRGFLKKDGVKSNVHVAVNGRPHVDAFVLTELGKAELARLDREWDRL